MQPEIKESFEDKKKNNEVEEMVSFYWKIMGMLRESPAFKLAEIMDVKNMGLVTHHKEAREKMNPEIEAKILAYIKASEEVGLYDLLREELRSIQGMK